MAVVGKVNRFKTYAQKNQRFNYFDWVDIVGNDNELSLLLLDECHDSVDTGANNEWTLGWRVLLAGSSLGGSFNQTSSAILLGLWSVLVQQLEQLRS